MKKLAGIYFLVLLSFSSVVAQQNDSINLARDIRRTSGYEKFRLGGYGEMLYQRMDYGPNSLTEGGAPSDNRALVDIPRMIIALDVKFSKGWAFSTEIEFEHGGTGTTYEYEYEESGEWEIEVEQGGEVVLEQFFISKRFSDALNFRFGHMIVPIGLTNQYHLPTEFFGTVRPEGENTIIPLTWHETGISVLGQIKRWTYEFQIVNGLDANGMTSNYWVRNARQTQYENAKFTDPAFVLRLDNRSVRNLKLGASLYYGNSAANSSKPEKMEDIDGTVSIGTFDAVYKSRNLIFRGNVVYGHLEDSKEIYSVNTSVLSRDSPYTASPVAKNALSYSGELGYNVFAPFNIDDKLFPFVRYDYYNTMESVESGVYQDPRFSKTVTTVGVNYLPIPNVCIKVDYSMRRIDGGNYNDENTFGISVGYFGIFAQK